MQSGGYLDYMMFSDDEEEEQPPIEDVVEELEQYWNYTKSLVRKDSIACSKHQCFF